MPDQTVPPSSIAADRAQSGALSFDDRSGRAVPGVAAGTMAQPSLSGGGRQASLDCGSPAPFGTASPSHSGTGTACRGAYQGTRPNPRSELFYIWVSLVPASTLFEGVSGSVRLTALAALVMLF